MTTRGWPLFDLRVRTPRLTLRVARDEELLALAERVAGTLLASEQAAFMGAWAQLESPAFEREFMRRHWRWRADWSAEDWRLPLGVYERDELLGGIDAWASDFPVLRSALTGSWLVPEARGRGLGKEARAAMLHLCFAGLGARVVRSVAHPDNAASVGVSRSLGYQEDGTSTQLGGPGEAVEVVRFKLTRERWRPREDIELSGLEACADLFGQ